MGPVLALDVVVREANGQSIEQEASSTEMVVAVGDRRQLVYRTLPVSVDKPRVPSATDAPEREVSADEKWYAADLSRNGNRVLLGGKDGRMELRERKKGNHEKLEDEWARIEFPTQDDSEIWATALGGPDDRLLAIGSYNGKVRVWNWTQDDPIAAKRSPDWEYGGEKQTNLSANATSGRGIEGISALAIHSSKKHVYFGTNNGMIYQWRLESAMDSTNPASLLPLRSDEKEAITGNDPLNKFYRYGFQFDQTPADDVAVYSMIIDQGGNWLVTGDKAGRILLWPLNSDGSLGLPIGRAHV